MHVIPSRHATAEMNLKRMLLYLIMSNVRSGFDAFIPRCLSDLNTYLHVQTGVNTSHVYYSKKALKKLSGVTGYSCKDILAVTSHPLHHTDVEPQTGHVSDSFQEHLVLFVICRDIYFHPQ